jgi:hypothetical protein
LEQVEQVEQGGVLFAVRFQTGQSIGFEGVAQYEAGQVLGPS